jgi:tetratricopeptide (TPR) repeat protein
MRRGDVPATTGLLGRAVALLPEGSGRCELLSEYGVALAASNRPDDALDALRRALDEATAAGDRVGEARARLELEYIRTPRTSQATGEALLATASAAIPVLEAAGEDRWLGRAWLLAGWIQGGRFGHHKEREDAAGRALLCYARSGWPTSAAAGEIANALYYGPAPVSAAIGRCEELLRSGAETRHGRANVTVFLGGLVAQRGEFEQGRDLIESARSTYEELGQKASAAIASAAVLGDVHLLGADDAAAEATFRWVCDELERTHAYSHLASRAGDLAEVLYRLGRVDEAADWVDIAEQHTSIDDVDARLLWMPVRGKIAARRGDLDAARHIVSEAARISESTDALNRRATIQLDLAEVASLASRPEDARTAFERAIALFEEKGNVVGVALARSRLKDPVLV